MSDFIDEINRWLPFLGGIAALLWPFVLYHLSKKFVGKAEYEAMKANREAEYGAMKEAQEEIADRLKDLERRMETVPDGKTMHLIQLSLGELRGDVKAQDAKIDGMVDRFDALANNVEMLIQHHLKES